MRISRHPRHLDLLGSFDPFTEKTQPKRVARDRTADHDSSGFGPKTRTRARSRFLGSRYVCRHSGIPCLIYVGANDNDPIRQGDCFNAIPRLEFSFERTVVLDDEGGESETSWNSLLAQEGGEKIVVAVPVEKTRGIVISQDCDCFRSEFISLCEVVSYSSLLKKTFDTPKQWREDILQKMQRSPRFFYLPTDVSLGIPERSLVDFSSVVRVRRTDLEAHRSKRVCRLNPEADEHFRESVSQYFRRYAVDAWYPLTKDEFVSYLESIKDDVERGCVKPRPWQQ